MLVLHPVAALNFPVNTIEPKTNRYWKREAKKKTGFIHTDFFLFSYYFLGWILISVAQIRLFAETTKLVCILYMPSLGMLETNKQKAMPAWCDSHNKCALRLRERDLIWFVCGIQYHSFVKTTNFLGKIK